MLIINYYITYKASKNDFSQATITVGGDFCLSERPQSQPLTNPQEKQRLKLYAHYLVQSFKASHAQPKPLINPFLRPQANQVQQQSQPQPTIQQQNQPLAQLVQPQIVRVLTQQQNVQPQNLRPPQQQINQPAQNLFSRQPNPMSVGHRYNLLRRNNVIDVHRRRVDYLKYFREYLSKYRPLD